MKKLFAIIVVFSMTLATLNAQDATRQKDKTQDQKRDRIHQEDHLMLKDGKLYQVQKGQQTQVKSQIKLKNGTVVNPDGSYQLKNQERQMLRDGECLDMQGNRYENQNMFNQGHMMHEKEMNRNHDHDMNKTRTKGNRGGGRRGGGK